MYAFDYNHYFILYEFKNLVIKRFTCCINLYNFFLSQLKNYTLFKLCNIEIET